MTDAALDRFRRVGASYRAEQRALATISAAYKHAKAIGDTANGVGNPDPSDSSVLLALVIDRIGQGGPGGVTGSATARMLSGLGSGRWQANDGGAYDAASVGAIKTIFAEMGGPSHFSALALEDYPSEWVYPLASLVVAALLGEIPPKHDRGIQFWPSNPGDPEVHLEVPEVGLVAYFEGDLGKWVGLLNRCAESAHRAAAARDQDSIAVEQPMLDA